MGASSKTVILGIPETPATHAGSYSIDATRPRGVYWGIYGGFLRAFFTIATNQEGGITEFLYYKTEPDPPQTSVG